MEILKKCRKYGGRKKTDFLMINEYFYINLTEKCLENRVK